MSNILRRFRPRRLFVHMKRYVLGAISPVADYMCDTYTYIIN